MKCNDVTIQDTYAEAFGMWASRIIITAMDGHWLAAAVNEATGYASSIIGCDAEAGLERSIPPGQSPDGRPGAAVLFFAFNPDKLALAVANRVGQCVMTCPTTAVFDGLPGVTAEPGLAVRYDLGARLRYFGDGHQKSKVVDGRRHWRLPVMEGEFLVEDQACAVKAVAGGNFLICGARQAGALQAARRAVQAIASRPDVITPFPGGVVRSGSKAGSRYKGLIASTNDACCPTLAGQVETQLPEGTSCVYEIVIDGLSRQAVAGAMRAGILAACESPADLLAISASNFAGRLGKIHLPLREVMEDSR